LQNSRTDENQLFSVIEGYYDNFRGTRLPEGFEKKRLGITDLLFRVNYLDNESLNIKPLDGKQLFTLKLKHQKGRTWQNGNIESNSIVR
jgi:hypothetical protein